MLSSLKATAHTTTSVMAGLLPSTLTGSSSVSTKPKVSFRDRLRNLQNTESKQTPQPSSSQMSLASEKEHKITSDDKEKLIESAPTPTICSAVAGTSSNGNGKTAKPSSALSFKDKIKQLGTPHARSEDLTSAQLRPWSKLKLATVLSGASSYASLNNSFTESSPTHAQQSTIKIAKIRPTTSANAPIPERDICIAMPSSSSISKLPIAQKKDKLRVKCSERICTSDSEIRQSEWMSSNALKFKSRTLKSHGEAKIYRSVDDLSPEYGGLPFVKKLKILNERQKLAELESVMTTRSFSLDCPEWSDGNEPEPLIRSQSEGSGLTRSKIATITSVAPTSYLNTTNTIVPIAPLNIPRSPVSPESNETLERRELKSILKKLSEEKGTTTTCMQPKPTSSQPDELKGLLSAPTVEGYVARHSKFMKSVTFNSTLSSPPTSAHSAFDEHSSFPLLSYAQTPNETTTLIQVEQHDQLLTQTDHSFLFLPDSINNKASSLQDDIAITDDLILSQVQISSLQQQQQQHHFDDLSSPKMEEMHSMKASTNPFITNKVKVKGKYKPIRYHQIVHSLFRFIFHSVME